MTFGDVVAAHLSDWMTVANALTGDEAAAADLVQAALTRTRRSWWRARRRTKPEAVVTSEIVRLFLRAGDRPEGEMPSRARAALVLRTFDSQTDEEIAERLRVSRGAARAAISRGLATLRESGADETMFARSNWLLTPEPDDVERVIRQASRDARRWRAKVALAAAAGVALVVAAAVAVPSIGSGGSPSAQPSASPLPEPQIESISSIDELSIVFADATVWELPRLEFGEGRTFEPDAVDESGRIVGTIVAGDPPVTEQVAVFDPASGEIAMVAVPAHRYIRGIYANDVVIVWAETDDPPTRPSPQLTWRCIDRRTASVHELDLPAGAIGIAADGRIAWARLDRAGDIYVAPTCGASFAVVADSAVAPQFAGRSLFYLGEDAIWRQEPAAAAAAAVADRPPGTELFEPRYAVSNGVLMYLLTAGRRLDEPWSYAVARLDGRDRQTVQVPHGFLMPNATNAWALAGVVRIPRSGSGEEAFSSWIYAPELGVIATFEPSTDPGGVPVVTSAAGDHLLMVQGDEPGDTRWWLVTFG